MDDLQTKRPLLRAHIKIGRPAQKDKAALTEWLY